MSNSGYIEIDELRNGYTDLVNWVLEEGKETAPRGQKTKEILNATVCLTNPFDALPVGIGRKPNLAIGAGEALQLIGGFSDPEMMVSIASSFERFLDGGILEGNYGVRIKHLLPLAIDRLIEDNDSRQAVVQVGRMDDYFGTPSRDLPCTKDLHFFVRDGELVLVTSMRSNDVWLGVAYDFFQFTQLQISVATALGLRVGPYYHHADSLHIYERNWAAAADLHPADGSRCEVQGIGWSPHPGQMLDKPIECMQNRARALWSGDYATLEPSEEWYVDQLDGHRRHERALGAVDASLMLRLP